MSDQMISGVFGAVESAANRLNAHVTQNAGQVIDDSFKRIAEQTANANGTTLNYDKNNYTRVAFTTKDEMIAFNNYLGNQGVDGTILPTKVNGQWQMEFDKSQSTLIDSYTQTTGYSVYSVNNYSLEQDPKYSESMASDFGRFMENNLDYLGKAIVGVEHFANLADRYGVDGSKQNIMTLQDKNMQDGLYGEFRSKDGGELDKMVDKLNNNAEFKDAVGKDLGLSFPKGDFTRADVLKLNQAFFDAARQKGFGISFIKDGKFDVNALKLPVVQNAFSKETLDLLEKVNTAGAWGAKGTGLNGLALKGAMKLDEDGDMSKMITTAQKSTKYTKQAATSVRQYSEALTRKIELHKANKANVKASDTLTDGKPKDLKQKKQGGSSKATEEKFIKKEQRKAAKLARSEKGIAGLYNRTMRRIMSTKPAQFISNIRSKVVALLIKLALLAFIALLFIGAIIILIMVIIFIVEAIANFLNGLKQYLPSYFRESAAHELIVKLKDLEGEWIKSVENWKEVEEWDKMGFGTDGISIDKYVDSVDGLALSEDGKILYIDPFFEVVGLSTASENVEDVRTEFKKGADYNGELTVSYSANVNKYGRLGAAENGSYLSTESGHTSNIKDIIAMTDVMFEMEMEAKGDDDLGTVLSKNPFKLDWDAFWDNWNSFWSSIGENIGTFFSNLFGGSDAKYVEVKGADGTVSYRTLQAYTAYLFNASHRSQADLSISYYPVKDIELNFNGQKMSLTEASEMGVLSNQASALGVCIEPITKSFKVYHNTANTKYAISPYLEDSDGKKYDLSTHDFGIKREDGMDWHITMFNGKNWSNNLCLATWFDANKDTWEWISSHSDCWTVTNEEATTSYTVSITKSGYETEKEAKDAVTSAISTLRTKYDTAISNVPASSYTLSSDWKTFKANRYVVEPYSYTVSTSSSTTNGTKTYSAKATCTTYKLYKEKYTHNCQGHEVEYCGGHLNVNSQGVVLSMTNEQLALAAGYNTPEEVPTILDFDFEGEGYGELIGKHIPENIEWDGVGISDGNWDGENSRPTAFYVATHGGGPMVIQSAQGSDVGQLGMNLYITDGGQFTDGYGIREYYPRPNQFRDIFDADCYVLKGNNVFPFGGDYTQYEGWSADNMSLAISRTTIDWLDTYGLDANIELDIHPNGKAFEYQMNGPKDYEWGYEFALSTISSTEDINNIINSLKATYGDDLSEEQEAVIRLALSWVNRGHYNEYHDHAFLSELCTPLKNSKVYVFDEKGNKIERTISYDVNCTASDDEGFIKFLLNRTGKWSNIDRDLSWASGWSGYSSTDDLRPADIIRHNTDGDYSGLVLSGSVTGDVLVNDVIKAYADERYVLVIGELGEKVALSNGTTLPKGSFLTLDLQMYQNIGTVRIHADIAEGDETVGLLGNGKATGWDDVGFVVGVSSVVDDEGKTKPAIFAIMKNYYWVSHPDGYTRRIRLY